MERGLLSDKELASSYGDVVWMYLFQDFSKSPEDRAAERVAIRFGISAWPQHFLVDPASLDVLGDTGRSLETFRSAVKSARAGNGPASPSVAELAAFDQVAQTLEKGSDEAAALKLLDHDDVVVRFRAVEILAKKKPEALVKRAAHLLAVHHDQTRGLVCDALAAAGDPAAAKALADVVKDTKGSKNPNVLRCRAVAALATCGDKSALDVIEPHAVSGDYRNSLTGIAVDAVVKIAERDRGAKEAARAILRRAFPELPVKELKADQAETEARLCGALAKRINDALKQITGKKVPFPSSYDEAGRKALIASWS